MTQGMTIFPTVSLPSSYQPVNLANWMKYLNLCPRASAHQSGMYRVYILFLTPDDMIFNKSKRKIKSLINMIEKYYPQIKNI